MRINKYLADKQYASRRGADELIKNKQVFINGRLAMLGDTVSDADKVEVKSSGASKTETKNKPVYYTYNKPVGVLTHSAQEDEIDIKMLLDKMPAKAFGAENAKSKPALFPIGRLDKDSHGLLILTNDGRITSKLLDPEENHEKEYIVETKNRLPMNFDMQMERGIVIEDGNGKKIKTKPCIVKMISDKKFSITLTEGKKRQIRKMCEALKAQVVDLFRVRILSIKLGHLSENNLRKIKGEELDDFLKEIGVRKLD